jgi:hypothetical protein
VIRGRRRFQITHRGGAGHAQHIALAALAQLLTKPRVAPQFIVTRHPAVRDLLSPQVEHLQTLVLSRAILHLLWHVAFFAPFRVSCPLLRQRQPEVKQGMVVARDVPHEDAYLAVVDFPSVATPLALHPDRMRAPLGKAAGIESNNAIGFTELIDHLPNQYVNQRAMIPGGRADELLQDQALDIDQRRDVLGILAWHMGQQPLEVEVHVALAGLGLQSVLIGCHELAQTVHHVMEHVGGNDTVTQQFLLTLCPRRCHLFASSQGHIDTRC